MDTEGLLFPETVGDARTRYAELEPVARDVVRASAKQMHFDSTEFTDRITDAVYETAQEAIFASLLRVAVGSRESFERWKDEFEGEVTELGGELVDNVAWHAPPWSDRAVATTFQNERDAAVSTLRRHAFGELYSEVLR